MVGGGDVRHLDRPVLPQVQRSMAEAFVEAAGHGRAKRPPNPGINGRSASRPCHNACERTATASRFGRGEDGRGFKRRNRPLLSLALGAEVDRAMHVILLALGLFMALAGVALVAYGIATNAGALGNTLIVVGT